MVKPVNEFGGWLRFFQILFGFIVVLDLITVGVLILPSELVEQAMVKNEITGSYILFAVIYYVIFTPILGIIVIKMNNPNPETALLISKLAIIYMVLLILASGIEPLLSSEPYFEAYSFPQHIMLPSFFYLYLHESRRVNAFYGVNPGRKEPMLSKEELKQIRKETFKGASKMLWVIAIGGVITLMVLMFFGYLNGEINF